MEIRARYATIGLFTLVVIALAFGFIYWLKRLGETGVRSEVLFEFSETVSGLAPGGAVYFAGIQVGNVTGLSFDPSDPNKVLVAAQVRLDTPIKTDTTAAVGANLLTGVAYIDMTGGSPTAPSLFAQSPPLLIGEPSGVSDAVDAANALVIKLDNIVDRIDEFLGVNQALIEATVGNVQTFTSALAENADGITAFLANVTEMSKTMTGLSDSLNGLMGQVNDMVASVEPESIRAAVESAGVFMQRAADASAEFATIVESAKTSAAAISEFSTGLDETLGQVRQVVAGLDETLGQVRETVAGIDANKIASAVDNVSGFSDQLKVVGPDLQSVISDAKTAAAGASQFVANLDAQKDNLNQIVADAQQLAQRLNDASTRLDSVLGKADTLLTTEGEDGETRNLFAEASKAAQAIRAAAEGIAQATDQVSGSVVQLSDRSLAAITALMAEIRASVARVDRAVTNFEQNPAGTVLGGNSGVRDYNRR